jgi:hypothetical protein
MGPGRDENRVDEGVAPVERCIAGVEVERDRVRPRAEGGGREDDVPVDQPRLERQAPDIDPVQGAHLIGREIEREGGALVAQRERNRRVPCDSLRPVRRNRERQGVPKVGDPG